MGPNAADQDLLDHAGTGAILSRSKARFVADVSCLDLSLSS